MDTRSSAKTSEVRTHIKNLKLTMDKQTFNGVDSIHVFEFMTCFVNEVERLNKSEAQAFVALPTFLDDPTETPFCINLSSGSRRGSVTC